MLLDAERCRQYLRDFDLRGLFLEVLGWDRRNATLNVPFGGQAYTLAEVAHKRGLIVFVCGPAVDGRIPDYPTRRKIERQVAKSAHEHLIVFVDRGKRNQVWQWVKREAGRPTACREHAFNPEQPGHSLIGKLERLAFTLDEEERITLLDATGRTKAAFDVEPVTKKFYDRFRSEHRVFLEFIQGIETQADREWYASLMLNRLMFVYFIQKKGFLNGDLDYLRNRLQAMQEKRGKGEFLTFYRYFLLRLFHEGLGQEPSARSADLEELLGRVPYLNGGIFDVHELERTYPGIEVPDDAFERIFDFFDAYHWHLDERPLRADNEINPDVLGYIFEKYINQKQMGAYYTKGDITEYIAKNTVVPFLLDKTRERCLIAFDGDESVWRLLRNDPDRYIYPAVKKGVECPLPEDIKAGIQDVSRRGEWNKPAKAGYALPTETWREVVARRLRMDELCQNLRDGKVRSADDLVTLNLDLCQFAQDVIDGAEGPDLLHAAWRAVADVTILDPTCGSGAFLFAALNILEPLYDACLERMESFVQDAVRAGRHNQLRSGQLGYFLSVLEDVKKHPNRRYFILKSIIVNNLYGVDIMEEAVEIAKLRLFLKLVAQVETSGEIEPLPDVDFNIRSGNTLVGFVSRERMINAMTIGPNGNARLPFPEDLAKAENVERAARDAERSFSVFRELQTRLDLDGFDKASVKEELRAALRRLAVELDGYLAKEYGIDEGAASAVETWRKTHQPFHWFAEFFGIMKNGGFDVVIGNPPYVEYNQVVDRYTVRDDIIRSLGNLHAMMTRRSLTLLGATGYLSFIVPVALPSTDRFASLRTSLATSGTIWLSHFDFRPAKLFEGAEQRVTIFVLHAGACQDIYSTRYNRWYTAQRAYLFASLSYIACRGTKDSLNNNFPK